MFKLKQINKLDLKPFKKQDYVNKHPHQVFSFTSIKIISKLNKLDDERVHSTNF